MNLCKICVRKNYTVSKRRKLTWSLIRKKWEKMWFMKINKRFRLSLVSVSTNDGKKKNRDLYYEYNFYNWLMSVIFVGKESFCFTQLFISNKIYVHYITVPETFFNSPIKTLKTF